MNAAKQEMFETVRSVVAGRLRDEAQIRELAHRISEESTTLRRRLDRAVGYARAGLRLEACAEAEAEPSVFELAAAFDSDVMRQWRILCSKNKLPLQDEISSDAIAEIEEAIALTAPLRSRLAHMRRLVLSDASAWQRLEILRELVARDSDNPAWLEDRAALEPVTANELGDRFEDALEKGALDDAELSVTRLEDGNWHWLGAAKVAAQLRARLDRALATRTALQARAVIALLDEEWAAENESGAQAALESWRDLEQRMLSYGSEMPGDLLARVDEAEAWLSARQADAAAHRENIDRVAALERLVHDDAVTLPGLRKTLRSAEQTVAGVPDDLRASAERKIDSFERAARMKRLVLIAAVVLVLIAGSVVTVYVLRQSEALQRIDDIAAAINSNVDAGRLVEADQQLAEAEKEPAVAGSPTIAAARSKLTAARAAIAEKRQKFKSLMAGAGVADSESAKPDLVEEAKQYVQGEEEKEMVDSWIRSHGNATDTRLTDRMREGIARAKAVKQEIEAAQPTGDASWDGIFSAWESALTDVRNQYGEFDEVTQEVGAGRISLGAQRAKTDVARVEAGRIGKLGELGAAATSPQKLADALAAYITEHDDSAEAKDFKAAKLALPTWEAVTAWSAVQPRPTVSLADRPQKERDAVATAIGAFVQAHQSSPYGSACEALTPLLAGAPGWRVYLTEKLENMEEFTYWMVEEKDGKRWYCNADPRLISPQLQNGVAFKSLLVYQGKAKANKTAFERFAQLQLKTEGPSPQTVFSSQLADLIADDEKSANDIDGAFDAISALRDNETVDGALVALLMQGLLDSMAPHMPEVVRPQIEAAVKRLAKEKLDTIDWINPRDDDARKRSRAAREAMREAAQPKRWREAYMSAMESACAPLAVVYEPAGVFVKSDGKDVFLPNKTTDIPANTTLWIAEPPIGINPGMMIKLGTVTQGGLVEFDSASTTVTPGNMVFTIKRGGKP
jgi:hypothetical protein